MRKQKFILIVRYGFVVKLKRTEEIKKKVTCFKIVDYHLLDLALSKQKEDFFDKYGRLP